MERWGTARPPLFPPDYGREPEQPQAKRFPPARPLPGPGGDPHRKTPKRPTHSPPVLHQFRTTCPGPAHQSPAEPRGWPPFAPPPVPRPPIPCWVGSSYPGRRPAPPPHRARWGRSFELGWRWAGRSGALGRAWSCASSPVAVRAGSFVLQGRVAGVLFSAALKSESGEPTRL